MILYKVWRAVEMTEAATAQNPDSCRMFWWYPWLVLECTYVFTATCGITLTHIFVAFESLSSLTVCVYVYIFLSHHKCLDTVMEVEQRNIKLIFLFLFFAADTFSVHSVSLAALSCFRLLLCEDEEWNKYGYLCCYEHQCSLSHRRLLTEHMYVHDWTCPSISLATLQIAATLAGSLHSGTACY